MRTFLMWLVATAIAVPFAVRAPAPDYNTVDLSYAKGATTGFSGGSGYQLAGSYAFDTYWFVAGNYTQNRFKGGIAPGAMPPLHKYLGNPVLSRIGQLFFRPNIGDFHCGLRGFNRARIQQLDLQTTGMEFASEMVVKASLARYRIDEVPTTLKKDGRSRPPHLRSWHDGWRHPFQGARVPGHARCSRQSVIRRRNIPRSLRPGGRSRI